MRLHSRLPKALLVAVALGACTDEPPGPNPAPVCTSEADCDDGEPCTHDACTAGQCTHTASQTGTPCGDGNACTGFRTCDDHGTCVAQAPVATDDGDPCTQDSCDQESGIVVHAPIPLCWVPMSDAGAPSPRQGHTAVWTGTRMIVWGGTVDGMPSVTATGASYDPTKGTWSPIATAGAPPARTGHFAAWTGTRMLVWGGYGATDYEPGGGIYTPDTDTWTPMSATGAPSPRTDGTAVWTGSSWVIWGGAHKGAALGDGAVYDPGKDVWSPLTASGAPSPRFHHTGVWASDRVVVWGGYDAIDWMATGASYDPGTNVWLGATPASGAPAGRERHSAVWTGARMVVWGGADPNQFVATGGSLATSTGTWEALASMGAPSPRGSHTALWTGAAMLVWGGCGGQVCTPQGDGGLWTPGANGGTWTAVPESSTLDGRSGHTAVWTGSKALFWGGQTKGGLTATGASFTP